MKHRLTILLIGVFLSIGIADSVNARGITQLNASKSIAHACEGLIIGYARNPALEMTLVDLYSAHVEEVMSMRTSRFKWDRAEAIGIITRGMIVANARNPSLTERFDELAQMCRDDIDAL